MKTIASVAIGAGFALWALAAPVLAQSLKIGTEASYKPFAWVLPSGELTGFDIDIAKALCTQMGATCEIVNQSFDGLIPALNAKKIDAIIASMFITPEREQAIAFAGPYYSVPALFVAAKDSGLEISEDGLEAQERGRAARHHDGRLHQGDLPEGAGAVLRHARRGEPRPRQRAGRRGLRRLGAAAGLPRQRGRRRLRGRWASRSTTRRSSAPAPASA